jgi:hypothetical protein
VRFTVLQLKNAFLSWMVRTGLGETGLEAGAVIVVSFMDSISGGTAWLDQPGGSTALYL